MKNMILLYLKYITYIIRLKQDWKIVTFQTRTVLHKWVSGMEAVIDSGNLQNGDSFDGEWVIHIFNEKCRVT